MVYGNPSGRPPGTGLDESNFSSSSIHAPAASFSAWMPSSPNREPDHSRTTSPSSRNIRTFAEVLANGTSQKQSRACFNAFRQPLPASFDNIHEGKCLSSEPVGIKEATMLDGKPCIYLSNKELDLLSKPLDMTLIEKFPAGRQKWISLQQYYRDLKLVGEYRLQHLDSKHIIIHFNHAEDYIRVFSRTISSIRSYTIKYLKWSKEFDVNIEPSVTPIWIAMPMLCMNLFTQNMIYSIEKIYGTPLLIDTPIALGAKPGVARALVEMDLLKDHPRDILMGNEEFSHLQEVKIERKPRYCGFCSKYGHVEKECFVKDPTLQKDQNEEEKEKRNHENNKTSKPDRVSGVLRDKENQCPEK